MGPPERGLSFSERGEAMPACTWCPSQAPTQTWGRAWGHTRQLPSPQAERRGERVPNVDVSTGSKADLPSLSLLDKSRALASGFKFLNLLTR